MSLYSEFAPWYEQLFPFREEVYLFLSEHAGTSGSSILDAGCGPGHYCSMFQHDGFRSTGIDLDPKMIDEAATSSPDSEFHCMSIENVASLRRSFRLIYSTGNVVAHLSPARFAAFLQNVYAALEPGGCWIFQVVNWDYILGLAEYRFPVKAVDDGSVAFYRRYPIISQERVIFDVELVSGGQKVFHEQTTLYPLTADSFLQRHSDAGFSLTGIYAGFDKTPFNRERDSGLVMVLMKEQGGGL
ncbi:MAG: class I SAM-dependent methyltransferase [Chlorobium sp.]|nr:MAG: class I SAM-dependent methyltransferase [Chlorobium sp.]